MSIKYVSIIGLALSIAPTFGMDTPRRMTRRESEAAKGLARLSTPTLKDIAKQIAARAEAQAQGQRTRVNKMRRQTGDTPVQVFIRIGRLEIHAPATCAPVAPAHVYGPAPMRKKPIMFDGTKMPQNWEAETAIEVCALCNTGFKNTKKISAHHEEVHGIESPLRNINKKLKKFLENAPKQDYAQL